MLERGRFDGRPSVMWRLGARFRPSRGSSRRRFAPPKLANNKFKGSTTVAPPRDDLIEANLIPCLPRGARICQALFHGRWEVYNGSLGGKWRSASRSWGSRSQQECVGELVCGRGSKSLPRRAFVAQWGRGGGGASSAVGFLSTCC